MMFGDPAVSDDLAEKIVAFVDREAGRDAPLTEDDEAMVRRLIEEDPAVRALADELRATNAGLDTLLDDVASVDVPDKLVALIRGHGASDVAIADATFGERTDGEEGNNDAAAPEDVDGDVVHFRQQAAPPRRSYGPLAAAASIAFLISSGALVYIYNTTMAERSRLQAELAGAVEEAEDSGQALADARTELQRLAGLAEQASDQSRETADQLMANEEAVQRLEVERAALEGRFAALESENQRLGETLAERQTAFASSETAYDRLSADLADARKALADAETEADDVRATLRAQIDDLEAERDLNRQEMASLAEALAEGQERSRTTDESLAAIDNERTELQRRLAAAEIDKQLLQAERRSAEQAAGEAERQLASLQAEIEDAEGRLATVAAGLTAAEAGRREALQQAFALEADLQASRSWLGQIAQYHRVYASTARRHLVEVGADELDHIQEWMTTMLGREILVPDLTEFGVTFAGARLLGINEKPVAQLVYLDADDQPLALCIIPSTGEAKDPTRSVNGELNLVDWRDGQHGYAVVGWSAPDLLTSLTQAIRPVYDL